MHVAGLQVLYASSFFIFICSKYDFPSSLREKKSLKYFSIPTCLNSGGFWGFIRLAAGLIWAEDLGLKNMAMEILSFAAFTVARCSMLVYTPLLRICKIGGRGSWLKKGHFSLSSTYCLVLCVPFIFFLLLSFLENLKENARKRKLRGKIENRK